MEKNDWSAISNQLQRIHPVMGKKLDLFEASLVKAAKAAKACEPEGVGLAIDAGKLAVALCHDVDHLHAVGIISEADRLKDGIETYSAGQFRSMFTDFAACFGKETETQIMTRVLERASELEPWCLKLLVNFAHEVREIERGRSSE